MRRLLFFALVVFAAWYGWNHRDSLTAGPSSIASIENHSDHAIERLRLMVSGKTLVREVIDAHATVDLPFRVTRDSQFEMHWYWRDRQGERIWQGGIVTAGPLVVHHHMVVLDDDGVVYSSERIASGRP